MLQYPYFFDVVTRMIDVVTKSAITTLAHLLYLKNLFILGRTLTLCTQYLMAVFNSGVCHMTW